MLVSRQLATGTDFRLMDFNRFAELYVCDGTRVIRYKVIDGAATVMNSITLASAPSAMAYDDATDTLALVTSTMPRSLVRYDRALVAGQSAPLPTAVNPAGTLSLAFSKTGVAFLCGDGSPAFHRAARRHGNSTKADTPGNILYDMPHWAFSSPSAINPEHFMNILRL